MHHIFVKENSIDEIAKKVRISREFDKENFSHLYKSLRINIGEIVLCSPELFNIDFDYKCKVTKISEEEIELDIEEKVSINELPIKINLYQGLPKTDKLEFIIEKTVELGVYKIIPVEMTNSVAKINEKTDKKIERFMKIAKSAAEQSKRHIVPEVTQAITYNQMLKQISGKISVLFYEDERGLEKTREYIKSIKNSHIEEINIIIGPEGGFDFDEVKKAKESGAQILSLGKRILRTETASITAISVLMYELEKD